ncbi:MAG: hypothetical protein H6858_08930 [Rhodospirillales bacterium]|nr:hypothetical protein [Alphaproteobacteria bacterium]MCB1840557.1 hypothetical protein [Alphaproteobacteria bacterium]MCB9977707.1 hypothetical protein [Rhodospirillales bacterium]
MRTFIILAFLLSFAIQPFLSTPALAQGVDEFKEIDIEGSAFPDTKRGCAKRASFNVAMADLYKNGKDPQELTKMKIIRPLVQNVYDDIGKKGLTRFYTDTLENYQECGKKAKADRNEEREAEQIVIYESCSGINEVTLDALKAVKSGRSKESLISKYEHKKLNVKGTTLEKVEGPAVFLVEQVYSKAEGSYDDAVDFAVKMGITCLNSRDRDPPVKKELPKDLPEDVRKKLRNMK